MTDHVLGPDRNVISLCCSVSLVLGAFRYSCSEAAPDGAGGGLLKRRADQLASQTCDLPHEWTLYQALLKTSIMLKLFPWQYAKAEMADIPVTAPSVPEALRIRQVGLSGEN